ncbi:GH116 family glycosyl-hydrolase, partial [Candidatus Hydrogenedentota bacterium]
MFSRNYNDIYAGENLNKVAFPLGGMGAGMVCLEGSGCLSHVSVRNYPDVFKEPCTFAAICIKGEENIARVLEGPVPKWKYFGAPRTGNGSKGKTWGLPRFKKASFLARFPFATVSFADPKAPLKVEVTGWSPFTPGDADNSSLPVAALEYHFRNPTNKPVEAVFSFNSENFMSMRS